MRGMTNPPQATTWEPRGGWWAGRIDATVEQLVLVASLFWALAVNRAFYGAALKGRDWSEPTTWGFAVAIFTLVVALHALLLLTVANRWTVKPLLAVLAVINAAAAYYMGAYGVVLDPSMVRNVLRTDVAEAGELLNAHLVGHLLLYAGLPWLLLWRVRVVRKPWLAAAGRRAGWLVLLLAVLVATMLSVFQPLAALTRNHHEVRYLVTPGNYLWSAGSVLAADARKAAQPPQAIGLDAQPGPSWAARRKPLVVVMVVGETARAANWGLSGYARQTTPQLAQLPVVNFRQVTSCGTNTEVSVPCMFAPVGRRDYDEARIRGQQSLLHLLDRAGVGVHWRDNQSGCKGVCDGLPGDTVSSRNAPGLCNEDHCLDEGLLHDMDARLRHAQGTQLWVFHMLGSHGPSYFRRYPAAFAQFQPDCRDDDLHRCSLEEVANAYDNTMLYTDHVLAGAIAKLRARAGEVDSALVYVSDHGESLGEHGLLLHGMPYAMAPEVQKHVPMIAWTSAGFEAAAGMSSGCLLPELRRRASQPISHDHLFHTLLGLLDVRASLHEPALDLTQPCHAPGVAGQP